jgi:serine/threonine-protein kinase RsbW
MAKRRKPTPSLSHPGGIAASVTLRHDRTQIDEAVKRVTQATDASGFSPASTFAVRLALEEALSNAFRHGHRGLNPELPVSLRYEVTPARVELIVTDQGPGFQPDQIPDPTLEDNLERPSGRGLMLMKAYMSKVEYNRRGNEVRLVFEKPAAVQRGSGTEG